jgi:hypothetical protein
MQAIAAGLQYYRQQHASDKFGSSYFFYKFVIGLQFSALVSRPSLACKSLLAMVPRLKSKSLFIKIHLKLA